jgi:quercetin dioxygenase-like cupin family protein
MRRDVLQTLVAPPLVAALAQAREVAAQPAGSPVKVDTNGLVAKVKFEAPLAGFLTDLNGKYKLRVTELTLAPGGYVGEHNHVGPGIRQVTSGYMTYVLPDKTVVYGPGEFFFESGDINHTVFNKTSEPMVHVLFEIFAHRPEWAVIDAGQASLTRTGDWHRVAVVNRSGRVRETLAFSLKPS